MTQRQAIRFTRLQLLEQFRASFPEMVHVAENSDLTSFKSHIEFTHASTVLRGRTRFNLPLLRLMEK